MESLDVVKYIDLGDIPCRVSRAIGPLPLEHPEEAFASRIVTAMPYGAHGANQRILFKEPLVIAAAKLAAAIRMQYDRSAALTLPDCHFNRSNHHLAILAVMH